MKTRADRKRGVRIGPKAMALALAGALVAPAGAAPAAIHLSCRGQNSAPDEAARLLCEALAAELSQRLPDRTLLRDGAAPAEALTLVLTVTSALPSQISAYLSWRHGTDRGATMPLSLSVEDSPLRPHMYAQLARGLVAEAEFGQ